MTDKPTADDEAAFSALFPDSEPPSPVVAAIPTLRGGATPANAETDDDQLYAAMFPDAS